MQPMIFVNLPVADLPRSVAFYRAIGATPDPRFTDDTAACMNFSDAVHVMLLTHPKFAQFTNRPVTDPRKATGALFCLSSGSRTAVDETVARAAAAGGRADHSAPQEHGFMYGRSFEDPDGHVWEAMWMDAVAAEREMSRAASA